MAITIESKAISQETPAIEKTRIGSTEDLSKDDDSSKVDDDYTLSGAQLHVIIFGLGLAVFLMALDMSILVTAIPLITEKFQSTTDIGWYMSAYSLSMLVKCAFLRNTWVTV